MNVRESIATMAFALMASLSIRAPVTLVLKEKHVKVSAIVTNLCIFKEHLLI